MGAPCGFAGRFEDSSSLSEDKDEDFISDEDEDVKNHISFMVKNDDYHFQSLLKMMMAFFKFLKKEDLKTPVKIVKKMKIT